MGNILYNISKTNKIEKYECPYEYQLGKNLAATVYASAPFLITQTYTHNIHT